MTQCWTEGELRAYLDRELPPEEIRQAAVHLTECSDCEALCKLLAARASRVAMLVDLLPELEAETLHVPVKMPRRPSRAWRVGWVGPAVALAAALGVIAYLLPKRQEPLPVVSTAAPPKSQPSLDPLAVAAPRQPEMSVRSARNTVKPGRRHLDTAEFVALDDEPFESGVVVRVAVTPGKTQADIVFGPDGRARAFRLVKAPNQKF